MAASVRQTATWEIGLTWAHRPQGSSKRGLSLGLGDDTRAAAQKR
jgi:hypothetical protein